MKKRVPAAARNWVFYPIVFGFWLAIVVLGSARLLPATKDATIFVATRDLSVNHRIVDADVTEATVPHRFLTADLLTREDFVGRYVRTPINANHRIGYGDTRAYPVFAAHGNTIGWLPLRNMPAADVATLEVGNVVEVCNLTANGACGAMPIEAIACDTSQCWAAVRLSDARRRRFVALVAANATAKISVLTHDGGEPR